MICPVQQYPWSRASLHNTLFLNSSISGSEALVTVASRKCNRHLWKGLLHKLKSLSTEGCMATMLDDRNYEVFLHENRFRFTGDIMYSSCHPTWPFVQNFHCLCLCFLCCCTQKLKTKHTTTTTTTTGL